MTMKLASAMESVTESREQSPNRTNVSPGPTPGRTKESRGGRGRGQDENSGLVIFRQNSRSPSFLREGAIEPEPINNERISSGDQVPKSKTPKRG